MKMVDGCESCDVSKIVTTFLLNTCRLPQRLTEYDVMAAMYCIVLASKNPTDDERGECFPLTTGSVAEFYIEPMLPHVGDYDIMYHYSDMLVIPRGHPPPTQLPAEFHNYVKVLEITDSHLPGYVYLEVRYLLTLCNDDDKYNSVEYERGRYAINNLIYAPYISELQSHNVVCEMHGPAVSAYDEEILMPFDAVHCVRCLVWPPQAADWPTRHRNYGWPDSATLDRVVSNGCDVVGVAHRQCRQHEWMGKRQHRLSFSRAEIVLINSWMPVQQIVYHLLRYFIKTERLTGCADNSGAGTLSNYHIKTVMLWACELKPRSWWTENLNLVRICVELLKTLSVWLTDTRCPHYFINNCNLLDKSFNVESVASKLMSVEEKYLSTWFVNNYIRQCAQLCPENVSRLFNDLSTCTKLQNAVSEIVRWRLKSSMHELWLMVGSTGYPIAAFVSVYSLTVRLTVYWMNKLAAIDKRFCFLFSRCVATRCT